MKTNWSTFIYNYAAVEPIQLQLCSSRAHFLSVIDFLTNGTVNRIICDDDRINCIFFFSNYVIKFVSDLPQVCGFLRFPPPIKLTVTII